MKFPFVLRKTVEEIAALAFKAGYETRGEESLIDWTAAFQKATAKRLEVSSEAGEASGCVLVDPLGVPLGVQFFPRNRMVAKGDEIHLDIIF